MEYLLINHVPFGRTADPGEYAVGDLWLEDLRAQVRAIRPLGRVTVATPLVDGLRESQSGSFHLATARPADEGFDYVPLPAYRNLAELASSWLRLRRILRGVIARADIVQADYGGHPFALGQIVWPWAGRLGKKRIWIFDGADPVPRMELALEQETRWLRRMAKGFLGRRFVSFCRAAIRDADLVFTHNDAVRQRFSGVWHGRCHSFSRTFVRQDDLVPAAQMQAAETRRMSPGGTLRLAACGRQTAIKATDHVIRAMALARDRGVKLELSVIGDGDALGSYRDLARGLGLSAEVHFAGAVPYGPELFREVDRCDVMVITNVTAEISRNVFLAMARGLPIVTYGNPATDELIASCGCGTVVPAGDSNVLAEAFAGLHRDRRALVRMGSAGVAAAARNTLDNCHRRRAALVAGCF